MIYPRKHYVLKKSKNLKTTNKLAIFKYATPLTIKYLKYSFPPFPDKSILILLGLNFTLSAFITYPETLRFSLLSSPELKN